MIILGVFCRLRLPVMFGGVWRPEPKETLVLAGCPGKIFSSDFYGP